MPLDLEGIGVIKQITFKDAKLNLTVILNGLENHEITVTCDDIGISPDGASLSIGSFASNMPFVENALNRFAPKIFAVPEGKAREALIAAKQALEL